MGDALADFTVETFRGALAVDKEKFLYYDHYFEQLENNEENQETARRIAAVASELRPKEASPTILNAVLSQALGEHDKALKLAVEAFKNRLTVTEEYKWRRVLDKISAEGMSSLTPEERKLLDDVSRRQRTN